MITIDSKLEMFRKLVVDKAKLELEEQIKLLDEKDELVLSDYKSTLEEKADRFYKEHEEKAILEKRRLISKARINKNKEVLLARKDLIEQIVEALEEKAVALTKSDHYDGILLSQLNETYEIVKELKGISIELHEKDLKYGDSIVSELKKLGYKGTTEITKGYDDMIGGYIVIDSNRKYRIDHSFKTVISNHQEKIGGVIYDLLDKEGE